MDNLGSKDDNNNDNGKAKRKLKNVDHKSAKWSDELRKIFVDFAIMEIEKGNRPSQSFSTVGWKNLENSDFKQFKNKDLSIIWFQYNAIFSDVIATGERARAPSQHSGVGLDIHDDDSYKDTYTNDNEERSGDSHDIQNVEMQSALHASLLGDDYLFPNSSSFKRQKSNKGKKSCLRSRTKSGAASLKEDIHSLVELLKSKNIVTSSSSIPLTPPPPTIEQCMLMLQNIPGVSISSPIWNYGCHLLKENDSRTVFMNQPSDEARLSFLEFTYQMFLTTRFPTSG
ncbi:hypothetical protein LIER_36689 [Lithospermum erythrorhizon]|uniref:Myb/SANT-like domain-containing protein n=1 Tax=Lithospermum erythrorhizon TaxID=34254 RepID=A0AAV3P9I3_LITER